MASPTITPDVATDQGESDPIAQGGNDSVTANAGAPTPQPQTEQPAVSAQVPTTPTAQAPTVLVKQHRGGLAGIVDEFRDAVAGTQGRGIYINPDTGERFVQTPPLTGKQQWAKIAGEGLVGASAGFAAGHGAGNMAKAPFAGVQAQQQLIDKNRGTQDQEAEQDYERDKQAKLAKANSQLLATQIASNQFKLQRMGVDASEQDVKFSQDQEAHEKELGSADLGTYNFDNLHEVQAHDPDFWKHHYADNTIRSIPAYDADGKRIGIHLFLRQPGIGDQPAPEGTQISMWQPPEKPGAEPSWKPVTLTGQHTLNEVDAYQASQQKKDQDFRAAQAKQQQIQSETAKNLSEVPKNKAETARNYAEAGKAGVEAQQLKQEALPVGQGGETDLSKVPPSDKTFAQGMIDGKIKTSDLGRMGGPQKMYYMKLAQAMDPGFSTTTYGDRQKLEQDFQGSGKDAVQLQSAKTFLRHAQAMSNVVNTLRNTGSPIINTPLNKLATQVAGNPQLSSAIGPLLAARTEYLNFLNNNHALSKEDKQSEEQLLNLDQSPAMLQANLKTMAHTAALRMDETNNKYVEAFHKNAPGAVDAGSTQALQHFGLGQFAQRLASPNVAPPGADGEVHAANGQVIGHTVNGKYVPLQQ